MKHYLWILKTTHGGADMDTCLEMAKGALDGNASLCIPFVQLHLKVSWIAEGLK